MTTPASTDGGVLAILEHVLATAQYVVRDGPLLCENDPTAVDLSCLLGATDRALARYRERLGAIPDDVDF